MRTLRRPPHPELTSPAIEKWRRRQRESFNFNRVIPVKRPRTQPPTFWERARQFLIGREIHSLVNRGIEIFHRHIDLRSRIMEAQLEGRLEREMREHTPPFDFRHDMMPILIIGGVIILFIFIIKK